MIPQLLSRRLNSSGPPLEEETLLLAKTAQEQCRAIRLKILLYQTLSDIPEYEQKLAHPNEIIQHAIHKLKSESNLLDIHRIFVEMCGSDAEKDALAQGRFIPDAKQRHHELMVALSGHLAQGAVPLKELALFPGEH